MKTSIYFLLFFLPFSAFAQQKTDFGYITASRTLEKEVSYLNDDRYDELKEIYDNLVNARGDRRYEPPAFKLSTDDTNVAFFETDGLSIGLEVDAYNICKALGEDKFEAAAAALLAHELIHFYEKHKFRKSFIDDFRSTLEVGKTLDSIRVTDKVNNEVEADYLGGFLAYSAGYPVFDEIPELLDSLQKGYNLPKEKIKGKYPSMADRKKMAELSNKRIRELIEIFEMANLLTLIGRPMEARAFYKQVLADYQGREIYNNLGFVTVVEALQYFGPEEIPFRLPMELDLELGKSSRDGFSEKEIIREKLLREAITYFDNAISMDPDYASAYQNKACAYYLLKEYNRATFYALTEAKTRAAKDPVKFASTPYNATTLGGMIKYDWGVSLGNNKLVQEGKRMLSEIQDKHPAAAYNLREMKDETHEKGEKPGGPEEEVIDDLEIGDLRRWARNHNDEKKELLIFGEVKFRIWENVDELKNSKLLMCKPPIGEEGPNIYFHITTDGYSETLLRGYGVGTSRSELTARYGEPISYQLPSGEVMVYEQMMFFLDKDEKVTRFAHYFQRGTDF